MHLKLIVLSVALVAVPVFAAQGPFVRPPFARPPVAPAAPTLTETNSAGGPGFGTRRLASSSAEEATIRELFHCVVRLLPDDRAELTYDFKLQHVLEDFVTKPGDKAPDGSGPWETRDGFLQKAVPDDVPLFHRARFNGPVTVAFKGFVLKGSQYAGGYFGLRDSMQLQAGVAITPAQRFSLFLAQEANWLAHATNAPIPGKAQEVTFNFDSTNFTAAATGVPTLSAPCKVAGVGQAFLAAPGTSVAIESLKITGKLDLDWFRQSVDARLTTNFLGRTGPRYGPPPATETQLRQMIRGFQRLLPNGQIELAYNFNDPAQFSDWQVMDPRGRADPFAWRVYNGAVYKSQYGPTTLVLQPRLVGPMKISARGAILSGSTLSLGLRDVDTAVRSTVRLGMGGFSLGDDNARVQPVPVPNVMLKQFQLVEMTRDDEKVTAKFNNGRPLAGATKRAEPLGVALAADDSTAVFDDVSVVAYLDYDWCVRELKLHGYQVATLPMGLRGPEKKTNLGKPTLAVAFSSSSQIKVQANADWMDTRIMLRKGDTVNFAASGTYQYERNAKSACGPSGFSGGTGRTPPCPKLMPCALIGRIGFTEPFEVGGEMQIVAKEMGQLYLRVNEQPVSDNSGALDVEIVVIPVAK
ncbi:MAG: hypothetical protein WCV00_21890 [Verrucomicrobiia bacterium]